MRTPGVTALLVLALCLAGCATGTEHKAAPVGPLPSSGSSSGSSSAPSGTPSATAPTPPGTTACDEVVKGIDAFNLGDFEETIAHFEQAVPLAEAEAAATPSDEADDLVAAVRYYAALPAEDYLEASAHSPDFAKYKAITLGQCAGGPTGPEDPGSSGVSI